MLGEGILAMGTGGGISVDEETPATQNSFPGDPLPSGLRETPGRGRSSGQTGLTTSAGATETVGRGVEANEDISGLSREEGTRVKILHSTPVSSGKQEKARQKQFVLRFRRNDSMPECEFLNSGSPKTPSPLPSVAEAEDESTNTEGTYCKPKAFTLRLNSNDSMPECLFLPRQLSSPSTTSDELSPMVEEKEEEGDSEHDTSYSTLVMEEDGNPYHAEKELFFPVPGIDIDSFTPSSPTLSPSPTTKGRKVTVNGMEIALFYHNGHFYAVDEKCPHLGGPLHLGDIEDMGATESPRVVCPWHKWCFELATGKQVRPDWRHEDIQSFPVRTDPASGGVAIGFRSMNPNCFGAIDDF